MRQDQVKIKCLVFIEWLENDLSQLGHPQPEPQPQGAAQVSEERDPAEAGEVWVVESESLVQREGERAEVVGSADLGELGADDCCWPAGSLTVRLSRPVKQILQLGPGLTAQPGSGVTHFREISGGPEWQNS